MAFRPQAFNNPLDDFDDENDSDDVDDVEYNSDEATGMEMEAMLRRYPSRTNSGSLLYSRSSRNTPPPSSGASIQPPRICNSRGETLVRAAYSRLTRGSIGSDDNCQRSGIFRTMRGMVMSRGGGRLSYWVMILAAMIVFSLVLNFFEGSYATAIFGSVTDKRATKESSKKPVSVPKQKPLLSSSTLPAELVPKQMQTPTSSPRLQKTYKGRPTRAKAAAAPPTPILSIEQHLDMIRSQHNSTTGSYSKSNSFTTWLDVDETDPTPPKQKSLLITNGSAFVNELCDTRGTSWYPPKVVKNSTAAMKKDSTWQLRAPAFLLPGAAYSGTVYMAAALHQHSSIVPARTKELQFFHERPFRRYTSANGQKTLVKAARDRMYARDYDVSMLKRNSSLVSFDATPGYLFYSSLLPLRILCVEPWVKLVIMLRNPVDRVLEHYAARVQRGLTLSLEEWIDNEFTLLQRVGLIPAVHGNGTAAKLPPKFAGSPLEDSAWYNYTMATVDGGIGRSMYVIQIRHWINALVLAGRDPTKAILIVRTERVGANPDLEYARILSFLGLPSQPLTNKHRMPMALTHQTRPVSVATRQRLEDFFRPYNQRLKRLLQAYQLSSSASG